MIAYLGAVSSGEAELMAAGRAAARFERWLVFMVQPDIRGSHCELREVARIFLPKQSGFDHLPQV